MIKSRYGSRIWRVGESYARNGVATLGREATMSAHLTFVGRVRPAAMAVAAGGFEGVMGAAPLLSNPNSLIWLCCRSGPLMGPPP